MTDVEHPLAVRRLVSFCEALHHGTWVVEGVRAARVSSPDEVEKLWEDGIIAVLVDPDNLSKQTIKPHVSVDAILAKKNLGTAMIDAPLVIALGPGFYAGRDVHFVVETDRGHDLGRLISEGEASPNTGVPGEIADKGLERILRSPCDGVFQSELNIGLPVEEGDLIGHVAHIAVRAGVKGIVRGLLRSATPVTAGLKIGDVDPRGNPVYCHTISDKARAIAGTVLEAILMRFNIP
jgi:xanthine dehydrogenase accessory factor